MDPGPYLLRLALVLPLLCLGIVAALWLARRHLGAGLAAGGGGGAPAAAGVARVAGWTALGPGLRLATVDFAGRRLLLGVSRGALTLIADAAGPAAPVAGAGLPEDAAAGAADRPSAPSFAALLARRLGHG